MLSIRAAAIFHWKCGFAVETEIESRNAELGLLRKPGNQRDLESERHAAEIYNTVL